MSMASTSKEPFPNVVGVQKKSPLELSTPCSSGYEKEGSLTPTREQLLEVVPSDIITTSQMREQRSLSQPQNSSTDYKPGYPVTGPSEEAVRVMLLSSPILRWVVWPVAQAVSPEEAVLVDDLIRRRERVMRMRLHPNWYMCTVWDGIAALDLARRYISESISIAIHIKKG